MYEYRCRPVVKKRGRRGGSIGDNLDDQIWGNRRTAIHAIMDVGWLGDNKGG
jgi:hypothetical protein